MIGIDFNHLANPSEIFFSFRLLESISLFVWFNEIIDSSISFLLIGIIGSRMFNVEYRKPIKDVNFTKEDSQLDLFNSECEGMCGV